MVTIALLVVVALVLAAKAWRTHREWTSFGRQARRFHERLPSSPGAPDEGFARLGPATHSTTEALVSATRAALTGGLGLGRFALRAPGPLLAYAGPFLPLAGPLVGFPLLVSVPAFEIGPPLPASLEGPAALVLMRRARHCS